MKSIFSRVSKSDYGKIPEILSRKYQMMALNPFVFFRGSQPLFFDDFFKDDLSVSSPLSWLCGDMHVENFGSYKGSNGLVYFDLNDFDEAVLAPVHLDIVRLAVSLILCAREAKFSSEDLRKIVSIFFQQYAHQIHSLHAQKMEIKTSRGTIQQLMKKVAQRKEKDLLLERTELIKRNRKLQVNAKLLKPEIEQKIRLMEGLNTWLVQELNGKYKVEDVGFRVAGTGSLGVHRFLYLISKQNKQEKQWKLIDVKQSVKPHLTNLTTFSNQANRIVTAQNLLQDVSPNLLSALSFEMNWYVVKEMQPTEDKVSVMELSMRPKKMLRYFEDIATIAASAHLRSSGKLKSAPADDLLEFANELSWQNELTDWSLEYAEKTVDYTLRFSKEWSQSQTNLKNM
ncbi:MAG: DUF2252 family protein [Bacteroidetes bacterium]|nr:DUF2252 family protein [Bacteroidota bacterium]MBS1741349.1 DUF2252 family protein [Bacteroidota bacterium]